MKAILVLAMLTPLLLLALVAILCAKYGRWEEETPPIAPAWSHRGHRPVEASQPVGEPDEFLAPTAA